MPSTQPAPHVLSDVLKAVMRTGNQNRIFAWSLDTAPPRRVNHNLDNMAASSSTAVQPSIPVVFSTKTPYQLPPQKFMIPASWRRFQLSQLINTALALPRVVPFDFLICGVLLRGCLSEAANGEVSRAFELLGHASNDGNRKKRSRSST